MKRTIIGFVISLVLRLPAAGDFQAGLRAYQQGDYATALKEWRPAAEQGDDAAQFNLGVLYANGQGVRANPAEARKWFARAAQHGMEAAAQGMARAEFQLGVMYDLGQGARQDYAQAIKWYRQAAEQGDARAMTNLGILYYNQQGVRRDLVQAYAWFQRAAKAGDPRAGELLRFTADNMRPKEVRKAEEVASNWQPAHSSRGEADRMAESVRFTRQPAKLSGEAKRPLALPAPAHVQDVWTGVERVVAVGDVRGDFAQFAAVLRSAGLIDDGNNWTGGKTHLVQTGDVVDGSPDSRKVIDLLMKLERQAAAAGGAVHALIGDCEAMDMEGDLHYEAADHAAFLPSGKYGRWISSHNAVIKINDTLFVHAGLGPKYASWGLERINQDVRKELRDPRRQGGIASDPQGPLWYGGLAQGDGGQVVDAILENFGVRRIVAGHIATGGAILPADGGKVILIDAGLSRIHDNRGRIGCLVIEHGQAYALDRGEGLALPADAGLDLLRYLRQAAALDPAPSPLLPRIAALEASLARASRR
jgi:Sel1 repeat/Calcineurin-like phosphoesterase